MRTIYKYLLNATDEQVIELPEGAQVLTVQNQGEALYLWALVETSNEKHPHTIYIVGTGHSFNRNGRYIATVQMMGGALVWHVFIRQ